jgi:hypothetical protein
MRKRNFSFALSIFFLFLLPLQDLVFAQEIISVKHFGAIPNDSIDDAPSIRQAVEYAIQKHCAKITFEPGVYDIVSLDDKNANEGEYSIRFRKVASQLLGIKDVSFKAEGWGPAHVNIIGAEALTIEGALGMDGKPATRLLRKNPMVFNGISTTILAFSGCIGITMRNLIIDNNPNHCTSGEVVEVGDRHVVVDIFEGLPRIDNMPSICANAWDLRTMKLKEVPSLTFDKSPANWRTIDGGDGRRMRIDNVDFSKYLSIGDGISWWVGHFGVQTLFNLCKDVLVENVRVPNAAGFGLYSFKCVNVTGNNVVFKPEGKQLPVGPRDGWNLSWNDGVVKMKNLHVEGVRWDGQNVHGPWLYVVEKITDKTILFVKKIGAPPAPIISSEIGFHFGEQIVSRRIASWVSRPPRDSFPGENLIEITFEQAVPQFVKKDTLASVYCYDIDRYELTDSYFGRIAGCGSIIKNQNVFINRCIYENIMYPALALATEKHEGTYPRNVKITNSTFLSSGWISRFGVIGAIGIGVGDHLRGPKRIQNIQIKGNTFRNMRIGIDISDSKLMSIFNNTFENVNTPWRLASGSTEGIKIESNKVN